MLWNMGESYPAICFHETIDFGLNKISTRSVFVKSLVKVSWHNSRDVSVAEEPLEIISYETYRSIELFAYKLHISRICSKGIFVKTSIKLD